MASSGNSVEEKGKESKHSKKKAKETNSPKIKKENEAKKKPSNGTLKNSKVEVSPSSYSESIPEVEDGSKITETPTRKAKFRNGYRQKGKREQNGHVEENEEGKMNDFPMERVRRIARSEDNDIRITNEAVFLINIATEKFLEKFCEDAYASCVQDRKKSLSYKHLSSVVFKKKRYDFLSDFVPEMIKAEDALAERKKDEPEGS